MEMLFIFAFVVAFSVFLCESYGIK